MWEIENIRITPCKFLSAAGLSILLVGGGCTTPPQPYSPNYRYVSAIPAGTAASHGKIVPKGYDKPGATQGSVLVPDACIMPDNAPNALYLPSGCANNLNLQLMAEKESDLLRGRDMGPAMAAPVARAAKRIIEGQDSPGDNAAAPESTTNLGGL